MVWDGAMKVPLSVYVFLFIGLLAVSQSGNIIRIGQAHAVVIAAFRLTLASLLLLPLASRKFHELRQLGRADRVILGATGVLLAFHFFTWIAAVQQTTVANAAIFFSVNPVLVAIGSALFFGERISLRLAFSIAVGLLGVLVTGLAGLDLSTSHWTGDLWAFLCAVLFTAYFLFGKRLRARLSTEVYVFAVYGVAALTGLASMTVLGLPWVDYTPRTWLCFLLMALFPTLLGHTAFNHALGYVRASWLSTLTLAEPLLAGGMAYVFWGEGITWRGVIGYLLISASVLNVVLERADTQGPSVRS